jgi:hypothetical protein
MTDPIQPITLAVFPEEIHAQLLVDYLRDQGIDAIVSGGVTGGFRAEAPGMVKVLVHTGDEERAKALFAEWEHQGQAINWDDVDVGEMEDGVQE